MPVFDVMSYGAVGDGVRNDAGAIQSAADACAAAGGGRLLIPAGKIFVTGPIVIGSDTELHIEAGAVLKASGETDAYPPSDFFRPFDADFDEAEGARNRHALIAGTGCRSPGKERSTGTRKCLWMSLPTITFPVKNIRVRP